MTEQQIQTLSNAIMLISLGAVAIGVILAMYYLSSLRRFITLLREKEQKKWGEIGKPKGLMDVSPYRGLGVIKLILNKNRVFPDEIEKARLVSKRRFLIFAVYFVLIVLIIVGGVTTVGIIITR